MTEYSCRVCGNTELVLARPSSLTAPIVSKDFAITDAGYGVTGALFSCSSCGLLQCHELKEVLAFYETLEDPEYESGRFERSLQANALISYLLKSIKFKSGAGLELLDVGAGSGVLVEAAMNREFSAVGVEPSSWLASIGQQRGLVIYNGVLPHPMVNMGFDVITLVDVIEHVSQPLDLLREIRNHLKPGGIALVVTPDAASFFAKILGFKWWHYRIAHISYFNPKTLKLIAQRAGMECLNFSRPGWYFSYPYLRQRLCRYFPSWLLPSSEGLLQNIVIPLNLGDSILLICKRP
jgi:2-polyprenyl-3-methyl-5-hydroxy-6-metoxy-1,4-benzoquinol methylase